MAPKADIEQQHLQSLKYLAETTATSPHNSISKAVEKYDKIIKQPQLLATLQYAEKCLEPVETELSLLTARLREVAKILNNTKAKEEDDDVDIKDVDALQIDTNKTAGREQRLWQRRDWGIDKQKDLDSTMRALSDAIATLAGKKAQRVRCEGVLGEWLEEGR